MKSLRYIFLFGIVLLLFSCKKFSGSQEIPAYLKIKPWSFTTNYETEGAATQAITDAWVYINGNYLGCYEFKNHSDGVYVLVPILEKGSNKIRLYPGVKLNGISSTRVQYPFYKPYEFHKDLEVGKIDSVAPSTTYYSVDSTLMRFKREACEDFEDINNIQLDSTSKSKTRIMQISHRTNPNAWMDPLDTINHFRSGHVHLADSINIFDLASKELYGLPTVGNYILLEMDYKCTSDFCIGMYFTTTQVEDEELYYLKATNTWKKVYLNLSPLITDHFNATSIKYYIRGTISEGETADYYFDNLKLIYID